MGLMPQLDIAKMLATMMGSPDTPRIGWIMHFRDRHRLLRGGRRVLDAKLPETSPVGHVFVLAVIGWLIMIVILMPMAGTGLFWMNMGIMAAVMTLMLHLSFGAVLGWVYGRSAAPQSSNGPARA